MSTAAIPFVDLWRQHEPIEFELTEAITRVIRSSGFTLGEELEDFEREFAAYCGVAFGVGVSSGTDALRLALAASGVGDGDEVVTVPNTFIATAEAISLCGARPVFADIDEATLTMDPAALEAAITQRTKAVIPVHLYGRPAAMDEIMEIAGRYDLKVVEDACQAHGAMYRGRCTGSLGDAAAFSFYPGKNLGAFGDGGIVVTGDEEIAERIRLLRHHGQAAKNVHVEEGLCARLDALQAAVLAVKLRSLDAWNDARRVAAGLYDESLAGLAVLTPQVDTASRHVYHLYVLRCGARDALRADLTGAGIATGIHYPTPLHLQPAYRRLGYEVGSFPVAERAAAEIVSLPMFPGLRELEIERIADEIGRSIA